MDYLANIKIKYVPISYNKHLIIQFVYQTILPGKRIGPSSKEKIIINWFFHLAGFYFIRVYHLSSFNP